MEMTRRAINLPREDATINVTDDPDAFGAASGSVANPVLEQTVRKVVPVLT
jgi:hypothetical protein